MFVIDREHSRPVPIERASFSELGLRERDDLQEWIANIFRSLETRKREIEEDFGEPLEWDEMEGQQACRIKAETRGDIYNREEWPTMIDFMVDRMIRLVPALKERLQEVVREIRR